MFDPMDLGMMDVGWKNVCIGGRGKSVEGRAKICLGTRLAFVQHLHKDTGGIKGGIGAFEYTGL